METVENTFTSEQTDHMNILFRELERKLASELQHHINILFLKMYLKEKLIPRGLRPNCTPTFRDDITHVASWKCVLEKCLFDLMTLLIEKRHNVCQDLNRDIEMIVQKLEGFKAQKFTKI